MFCCVCCEDPLVRCGGWDDAIELPNDVGLMPAEDGSMRVPKEELEKRGFVYLFGHWYTPDIELVQGVYVLRRKE